MTGFEPATPGPPDQCANRAAPHPVFMLVQIYKKEQYFYGVIILYEKFFTQNIFCIATAENVEMLFVPFHAEILHIDNSFSY